MPSPSQRTAPIPARNGIAPSFLQLPTGDWPDLLHFLIARFPHIAPEIWQQRLAAGQVFDHLGQPHSLNRPPLEIIKSQADTPSWDLIPYLT